MKLRLSDAAREEIREASHRYQEVSEERRRHFLTEVRRCLSLIRDQPTLFSKYEGLGRASEYRRVLLVGYPYLIVNLVSGEVLSIIALAHGSRAPGYWERR